MGGWGGYTHLYSRVKSYTFSSAEWSNAQKLGNTGGGLTSPRRGEGEPTKRDVDMDADEPGGLLPGLLSPRYGCLFVCIRMCNINMFR